MVKAGVAPAAAGVGDAGRPVLVATAEVLEAEGGQCGAAEFAIRGRLEVDAVGGDAHEHLPRQGGRCDAQHAQVTHLARADDDVAEAARGAARVRRNRREAAPTHGNGDAPEGGPRERGPHRQRPQRAHRRPRVGSEGCGVGVARHRMRPVAAVGRDAHRQRPLQLAAARGRGAAGRGLSCRVSRAREGPTEALGDVGAADARRRRADHKVGGCVHGEQWRGRRIPDGAEGREGPRLQGVHAQPSAKDGEWRRRGARPRERTERREDWLDVLPARQA